MTDQRQTVTVDRIEFRKILDQLARWVGKSSSQILLSCSGDHLSLELEGTAATIPALGGFDGTARVPSAALLALRRLLPKEDPLTFTRLPNGLKIASTSLPCVWDAVDPTGIVVSARPDLRELYAIFLSHSPEEIERAGISEAVSRAAQEANRQIELVGRALQKLGVPTDKIRQLVEEEIASQRGKE